MVTKRTLLELMLRFTEALTHNNPSEIPMTKDCIATYQGVKAEVGSGEIWGDLRRIPYRQTFVDPITRTACFTGVVTNNVNFKVLPKDRARLAFGPQKWWIYYVRITANEAGEICEIEEIARPDTSSGLNVTPAQMQPPRILEAPLPEDEKSTREEMLRIGSLYWDANAKMVDSSLVPIHPDARRIEVGTPVSDEFNHPNSVRTQYDLPNFFWEVTKRRYPVVDVDRGILISTAHMIARSPEEPTGYVTDIFKIECGMIKYIYAFHDWNIEYVAWEGVGPQSTEEMDKA